MKILVLNGGSSSLKCWFADLPDEILPSEAPRPGWEARVEWNSNSGTAKIRIKTPSGATPEQELRVDAPAGVLEPVLKSLPARIDVVGHRIVHGGPVYRQPTLLTAEVRAAIAREIEFAPSHNRFELEAIRAVERLLGDKIPQVAVFDTGFHSTLSPAAYIYPGPYAWFEQGIRRFGFHGINHQYVSRRAAELLDRSSRLIVCHLGNGASLAAVRDGKSIDTTMGFTPLEGLMMGTRSGSIDPGILIYLIRHRGYAAEQLDRVLNQESGLLGVSGVSGDMREIIGAMNAGNQRAKLAFDIYIHRLVREIGGMAAVLGGVDALVFTGGVGEHSAEVRELVCRQLAFLGARMLVIPAGEEWEIARECHTLLRQKN
jgi:acetate kinase